MVFTPAKQQGPWSQLTRPSGQRGSGLTQGVQNPFNNLDGAAASGPGAGGAATAAGISAVAPNTLPGAQQGLIGTTPTPPPQSPPRTPQDLLSMNTGAWQPNAEGQMLYPQGEGPISQGAPLNLTGAALKTSSERLPQVVPKITDWSSQGQKAWDETKSWLRQSHHKESSFADGFVACCVRDHGMDLEQVQETVEVIKLAFPEIASEFDDLDFTKEAGPIGWFGKLFGKGLGKGLGKELGKKAPQVGKQQFFRGMGPGLGSRLSTAASKAPLAPAVGKGLVGGGIGAVADPEDPLRGATVGAVLGPLAAKPTTKLLAGTGKLLGRGAGLIPGVKPTAQFGGKMLERAAPVGRAVRRGFRGLPGASAVERGAGTALKGLGAAGEVALPAGLLAQQVGGAAESDWMAGATGTSDIQNQIQAQTTPEGVQQVVSQFQQKAQQTGSQLDQQRAQVAAVQGTKHIDTVQAVQTAVEGNIAKVQAEQPGVFEELKEGIAGFFGKAKDAMSNIEMSQGMTGMAQQFEAAIPDINATFEAAGIDVRLEPGNTAKSFQQTMAAIPQLRAKAEAAKSGFGAGIGQFFEGLMGWWDGLGMPQKILLGGGLVMALGGILSGNTLTGLIAGGVLAGLGAFGNKIPGRIGEIMTQRGLIPGAGEYGGTIGAQSPPGGPYQPTKGLIDLSPPQLPQAG